MSWRHSLLSVCIVLTCIAFAVRTLLLLDATGLWSDELYSVGKSFQHSPAALLAMLRQDTHPPFYYGLLWIWGQVVGQTPLSLRFLSWLAYCVGAAVMLRQADALAHEVARTLRRHFQTH